MYLWRPRKEIHIVTSLCFVAILHLHVICLTAFAYHICICIYINYFLSLVTEYIVIYSISLSYIYTRINIIMNSGSRGEINDFDVNLR